MSGCSASRSAEEIRQAVLARELTELPVHNCSMCNYPCGYRFREDGVVVYDSGCWCVAYRNSHQPRDWQDVADHYNRQTHPNVRARLAELFGFSDPPSSSSSGEPR